MSRPLLVLPLLLFAACAREARRPNVLLITLDTFRADRVGALTPNLARLANEGVRFEHAVAPAPLTLPAHASMLTGALPQHHGLRNNGLGVLPAATPTLPTALRQVGYRTGAFVGSFVLDRRFGLDRGFETYDDEIARDPNAEMDAIAAERRGDDVVDRALAWIARNRMAPFFAWVHLYDAHAPYAPPPPYPRSYDGEIAYVDSLVGRLLAGVDRANTVVVVVADHGEGLGEHDELTHGILLYESTLRVPWIVAGPDIEPRLVSDAVSTVDLAPTVAELAGVTMRARDGRSLAPVLRGGATAGESLVYSETEYPATFGWGSLAAMRKGPLKLIAGASPELYDLRLDARETRNVVSDQRRVYRELQTALESARAGAKTATQPVDAETRAKLASLGYVAPVSTPAATKRDVKLFVALFRDFEEATTLINHGEPDAALPILEKIIAADPANPSFRMALGRAYRHLGDSSKAIAFQQEAVAVAPGDLDAWYDLAVSLQENGRTEEAEVALGEVLRRDERRPEARNLLGVVRMEQGKAEEGASAFRQAIDIDRRNARAWNNLGNALRVLGRANDALAAYEEALRIAPEYVDAMNGAGVILVQTGRAREAVAQFDRILRVAPRFHEARVNRAVALATMGERDAAAAELRALLAQGEGPAGPQRKAAEELLRSLSAR